MQNSAWSSLEQGRYRYFNHHSRARGKKQCIEWPIFDIGNEHCMFWRDIISLNRGRRFDFSGGEIFCRTKIVNTKKYLGGWFAPLVKHWGGLVFNFSPNISGCPLGERVAHPKIWRQVSNLQLSFAFRRQCLSMFTFMAVEFALTYNYSKYM